MQVDKNEYVLSYYPEFKCIASKCKHTCCAGWEMNIDAESLSAYKGERSVFSNALSKGINFKKSKFKADKLGRCAFLNEKGLCEIIINLGEKSLCQVCRDHPRFRSFFDDRIETGLGFSCEEATRLILSYKDKIQPVLIVEDKGQKPLDFNQKNVLEFRAKILSIVQDLGVPVSERISGVLKECRASVISSDYKKIVKAFLSLERLDKGWTKRLKLAKICTENQQIDEYFEQFFVNSIYRHLSDAEDTLWVRARALSCVFAWWIIVGIVSVEDSDFENVVDVVRQYSTEVEYSQKNLDKLFKFAYKFIKI